MPAEIHQYDIGTVFIGTVVDADENPQDISAATTKQLILLKPNGERLERNASYVNDGTDGKIKYLAASGELDRVGMWKIQGYVVQSGTVFHTDVKSFKVYSNI